MQVLCTFNEKSSNFFKDFFVLRGSNDVTVPGILLSHCSNKYAIKILQDIRVLILRSIASISSDSEIASGGINLENNE